MVNKLHCLVDIILIVFFLGLPCVPSPSLLLFVLFEFHPRHSYQKMRRWVCITRQFFLRFFSISSLTCQQPPSLPHNPHPVFFSLWLLLFSLCFFHITADFQQVKNNWLLLPFSGQLTSYFIFFHTKSPHFLWGLSSRTDRSLPQSQRWWPRHRALKEKLPKKWQPLTFIAGALTVVSNSLWRMACPHFIDLSPSKLIETSTLSPK